MVVPEVANAEVGSKVHRRLGDGAEGADLQADGDGNRLTAIIGADVGVVARWREGAVDQLADVLLGVK